MTTKPKKDHYGDEEMDDRQLDSVAGGNRVPLPRVGKNVTGSELNDGDLEGVSGGELGPSPTEPMPPRVPKRTDMHDASAGPD